MTKRKTETHDEWSTLTPLMAKMRDIFEENADADVVCTAFIILCTQTAQQGELSSLSPKERAVAALALNRPDWLAEMQCTLVDAIGLCSASVLALLPDATAALQAKFGDSWRETSGS